MAWLNRVALFGAGLIALNYFTNDFLFARLGGLLGANSASIIDTIRCGLGLALFPPVTEVVLPLIGKTTIFYPTFDDVIYSLFLTLGLLWLGSLVWKEEDVPLWGIAALYVFVWVGIKTLGLLLITLSGSWCINIMATSGELLNPFYQMGLLLVPIVIIKIIWSKIWQ